MKWDKREISLNETDSVADACAMEKALLHAYIDALCFAYRQETKKELLRALGEAGEDYCFALALSESVQTKNGTEENEGV